MVEERHTKKRQELNHLIHQRQNPHPVHRYYRLGLQIEGRAGQTAQPVPRPPSHVVYAQLGLGRLPLFLGHISVLLWQRNRQRLLRHIKQE